MNNTLDFSCTSTVSTNHLENSVRTFTRTPNATYLKNYLGVDSTSTKFGSKNRFNLVQLKENLKILNSFKRLENGWDGEKAPAIDVNIIEQVETVIKSIEYQPDIFPTARNSVQIEFEKSDESYLEFEFFMDKVVCYIENDEGGREDEVDLTQVKNIVSDFYE